MLLVELLIGECELLLRSLNLTHQLSFVKGLLVDNLATQVLNLSRQSLFNRTVLLSHNLSPYKVQLVEDLADTSLRHLAIELLLDLKDSSDCLSWDPIVVFWPTLRYFFLL